MNKVITISREFGSGGREIGFLLSERLDIPFYDKELISLAAVDSNIAEEVFHAHDEMLAKQERIGHEYTTLNPFSALYEVPVSDQLFLAQSQIIRKLAQEGPCVIIGRCSDIIVEDGLNIFVCASVKCRVERLTQLDGADVKKIESQMRRIDRKRREYYQYYSGNEWGNPKNYHISLNSGKLGIPVCVDIVADSFGKL